MKYKIEELKINKLRWCLSLTIFVVTSIVLYSFLYMFRESIRFFSITSDHEIWVLTDLEVKLYNAFYAFVAIILATSSAINFLIDRPIGIKRECTLRTSILNDQRFLNWSFISWASKLSLVFGIFFCSYQGFYELSFISEYGFIIALIVIVLYLQIWTTIVRKIEVNKIKLWLFSSLIFLTFTFLLSQLNLIDYKNINEQVLKKNVYYNYEVSKPKSDYWKRNNIYRSENLFLVHSKTNISEKPKIIFGDLEIQNTSDLDSLIESWKTKFPINQIPGLTIQLNINSKTQMKHVNNLKHQLALSAIGKVAYSVTPLKMEGSPKRYKNCVIPSIIYNYKLHQTVKQNKIDNQIELIINQGKFTVNDEIVETGDLFENIKVAINNSSKYLFRLSYQDTEKYKNYIKIYSMIFKSVIAIRNEYALANYSKEFMYLDKSEKKIIRERYPIIIEDENYISKFDETKRD